MSTVAVNLKLDKDKHGKLKKLKIIEGRAIEWQIENAIDRYLNRADIKRKLEQHESSNHK